MYKRAFTIVELIVVITISLILIGGAALTYGRNSEEKKLDADAMKVASVLQTAHTKARTGDAGQYHDSTVCANMTGYEVQIDKSGYSVGFCCGGNCQGNVVQSYRYSPNITGETGYTGTTAINFRFHTLSTKTLEGEIGSVESYHVKHLGDTRYQLDVIRTNPTTFKLKHNILNQCINISVNAFGIITVGNKYTAGC